MPTATLQVDITVVDSESAIISLLHSLTDLPADPPSLYLDLEGISLGRHGHLSIMSLYLEPTKKLYLVDVHVLGHSAFRTTNNEGNSLKRILESPDIPKVVFDVRNDSDALFSHYQVSLDCIRDLQLMELATRKSSKDYVAGLAQCIEKHSTVSEATKSEWKRTKDNVSLPYAPQYGSGYQAFNERPIKAEVEQYCLGDVALLPDLWKVYNTKLCLPGMAFWGMMVRRATMKRIVLSQSKGYDPYATSKVYGPWDEEQIEREGDSWNDDIMMESVC